MSKNESSWIGGVELLEANHILKYKQEAVPTLNSYDNMWAKDAQDTIFCAQLEKINTTRQTQLISTRHNKGTLLVIYIMVFVTTDQYHIALAGMVS